MSLLSSPVNRAVDIACLGRMGVDLYAQQIGCSLEDAHSFSKYLGGSSANIAFGCARLGVRAAMVSRVGNEQNGRFLLQTLQREGCDTSQVVVDAQRLTAMVLLGIKDQETFPLLFVREDCADMALAESDIDEAFIASCRSLLITGTHLSTPSVLAASRKALALARKHQVVRVLDIDYRPVLWGLTGKGDGETRYVSNASVSQHLLDQLSSFDLIIGTEEEWMIAGGVENDLLASLRQARARTDAVLVVKRGPLGCSLIEGAIPAAIDDAVTVYGERVEVLNVLGAGDAFAAGFMTALLQGKRLEEAAALANACGAIVVSRHGCAPAMPTQAELAHWLSGHKKERPDQDALLAHLHRVTAPRASWNELCVLAYDHRSQFEALAQEVGASLARLPQLKLLINAVVEQVEQDPGNQGKMGVLIDGRIGEKALHAATGRGWWIGRPVERPGSRPLRFDGTHSIASQLQHWPREHTVKCLVFYHPDDSAALRQEQDEWLQQIWEATRHSGHELLLEVIPPAECLSPIDEGESVVASIAHFYAMGLKPEWWKVGAMSRAQWGALEALVQQHDPYCRGAVILGLSQPVEQLVEAFSQAPTSLVRGFMIGRTVWAEPAKQWLSGAIDDMEFQRAVSHNFRQLIAGWRASRQRS